MTVREKRKLITRYYEDGYTAILEDRETGEIIPGYTAWSLRYVLDELELRTKLKLALGLVASRQVVAQSSPHS